MTSRQHLKAFGGFVAIALTGMVLVIATALLMTLDESSRPENDDAVLAFTSRYGIDAEVLKAGITEDEVVARSFRVEYRILSSGALGQINIQFMNIGDRAWDISPDLPGRLP